ncbi:MAG: hypothetical protein AB1758_24135, partial [Candidatus Eremiobacterota bacterium]
GLVCATLLAVAWRLFSVELKDPTGTREVISQAQARARAVREIPPYRNGFYPLRRVFMNRDVDDAARAPWNGLAAATTGKRVDDEEALRHPEMREARRKFLSVLPGLKEALSRPDFAEPHDLNYRSRLPNFVLMRATAQSLANLGLLYEMEGHPDQALDCYLTGLKWGDRMTGQGMLIQEMICVALEAIALERIHSLQTRWPLDRPGCRAIIDAVESSRMRPENLARTLENEMAAAWLFLQKPARERAAVEPTFGLLLPAAMERYERIALTNAYMTMLPAVRSLKSPSLNETELISAYPASRAVRYFLPNADKAVQQYAYLLTRLEAARTIAAIQLYRMDHGRYPAGLQELVGPYLKTAPRSYCGKLDYSASATGFTLRVDPEGRFRKSWHGAWDWWMFYPYPN